VLHMVNTVTYFEHSFFEKINIRDFKKICFSMDFLNTKNYFSAFWILQHVCKFQRLLANILKIQKSYFWGIHLYSPLIFG